MATDHRSTWRANYQWLQAASLTSLDFLVLINAENLTYRFCKQVYLIFSSYKYHGTVSSIKCTIHNTHACAHTLSKMEVRHKNPTIRHRQRRQPGLMLAPISQKENLITQYIHTSCISYNLLRICIYPVLWTKFSVNRPSCRNNVIVTSKRRRDIVLTS